MEIKASFTNKNSFRSNYLGLWKKKKKKKGVHSQTAHSFSIQFSANYILYETQVVPYQRWPECQQFQHKQSNQSA